MRQLFPNINRSCLALTYTYSAPLGLLIARNQWEPLEITVPFRYIVAFNRSGDTAASCEVVLYVSLGLLRANRARACHFCK